MTKKVSKKAMKCNKPKRTPNHPKKSHIVKACKNGKEKIIRFGQQGAKTAGKPRKAGESTKMKKKRASFKARHAKNIKKGNMSAAYWANEGEMVMAKGVKHYKKDGTLHTGGTHKMPNGDLHSGKTHGKTSVKVVSLQRLVKES